jgi:DNA-binding transcriptional LysR family regulator
MTERPARRFDLGDLEAFAAVVRLGSFRAAAEAVHLSQPALSRRVEKLESALGVRLLERTTRRVAPTQVGREFALRMQTLLDDLDGTLLGIESLAAQRVGRVTIACVPSATLHFLPAVLRRFHGRYPAIRVRIHDAHAHEALAAVLSGEADFGLNFIGADQPELRTIPLLRERFVVACRRDHPLAARRAVRWEDLRGEALLAVDQTSGNRMLLEKALAGLDWRPQPVFEARHVHTLLGLVAAGLGVAAVPQLALPRGSSDLVGVPLTAPVVHRAIVLVSRRGGRLGPAARALHDFILEGRRPSRRA